MINFSTNSLKKFIKNECGNVALTFAILAVPLIGAAGVAIDYARVSSERSTVLESIDAALLAGAQETQRLLAAGKTEQAAIEGGKSVALDYYTVSMFDRNISQKMVIDPVITVSTDRVLATANFSGEVKTSLSSVFGLTKAEFNVASTVGVSSPKFLEFHFVVDNSNSMGIGASDSDIATMQNSQMSCAFACHVPNGAKVFTDTLDDARALGVTLRMDVVRDAVDSVLENIEARNMGVQVKAAVYTFSNDLVVERDLTENMALARNSAQAIELAGDWGTGGTSPEYVLQKLETKIGMSGDGSSQGKSKKILVFVTDGVASNAVFDQNAVEDVSADPNHKTFNPTYNGSPGDAYSFKGFNSKACRDIKRVNNADIYIVNVEYITPKVGEIDERFTNIEKHLKPQIEKNLKACATGDDYFFQAKTTNQINESFNELIDDAFKRDLILTQ